MWEKRGRDEGGSERGEGGMRQVGTREEKGVW